jgi:hypothetical protein
VAEQYNDRILQCVSGRDNCVHQGASHGSTLVLGKNTERPQSKRRYIADRPKGAHNMADNLWSVRVTSRPFGNE